MIKQFMAVTAGLGALWASSFAGEVAACPDDYPERAASYVESRLGDPRGARVQIASEPYRVAADVNGREDLQGWGVDIRVRTRQPGGDYGNYVPYTVVFIDGEPVALNEDADELTRV